MFPFALKEFKALNQGILNSYILFHNTVSFPSLQSFLSNSITTYLTIPAFNNFFDARYSRNFLLISQP